MLPNSIDSRRFTQTMGRGHARKEDSDVVPSTSGQPSQSNHERKKEWKKQQRQQNQQLEKDQTPPATPPAPPRPTHEIVKSGSTTLANGTRYIDVTTVLFLKSNDRPIVILS